MPELVLPVWVGLGAGLLISMTLFVMAVEEAARAARQRTWPRLAAFGLALVAGLAASLLLGLHLGWFPSP